ncbi:FAD-dependent monooxygenase [Anaerocolumna sp. MB42-C2]|nr:FAD-dependent monooxygenase [Anaerocolumna sp. MB42-C2]WMJ85637.1 FAD-dependent monooxygenase [Anaerocolumna sp. MB42-C2]
MSNVIIIGKGPAGISASLYTTRAGIDTIIIGKDSGALGKASEYSRTEHN